MRVIGLDLGTSMGWAFTDSGRVEPDHSGTWDFTPNRLEGGGMRFLRFKLELERLIQAGRILEGLSGATSPVRFAERREELARAGEPACAVFFEEAVRGTGRAHTGHIAREVYGGFLGVLTATCEAYGAAYQGVTPGELKTRAAGTGNATKLQVVSAARAVFGFGFLPERGRTPERRFDQADALWTLQVGLDRLGLPHPSPPGGTQ